MRSQPSKQQKSVNLPLTDWRRNEMITICNEVLAQFFSPCKNRKLCSFGPNFVLQYERKNDIIINPKNIYDRSPGARWAPTLSWRLQNFFPVVLTPADLTLLVPNILPCNGFRDGHAQGGIEYSSRWINMKNTLHLKMHYHQL